MIFEYCGSSYLGTRAEIQKTLRSSLDDMDIVWNKNSWYLGSDSLNHDYSPGHARRILTDQILSKVPQEKGIKFDGKIFRRIEELEVYLKNLILVSDGYGTFFLGNYSYSFYGRKLQVDIIKRQMIGKILKNDRS